jgi:hypothetical protein
MITPPIVPKIAARDFLFSPPIMGYVIIVTMVRTSYRNFIGLYPFKSKGNRITKQNTVKNRANTDFSPLVPPMAINKMTKDPKRKYKASDRPKSEEKHLQFYLPVLPRLKTTLSPFFNTI